MRMRAPAAARLAALVCSMCSVGALVPAARASVVLALDLDELVAQSDEIVVAEVLGQSSSWAGPRIVTDVRMRVEQALLGRSPRGSTLVVRRLGGNVGDVGMRVEGEPSFAAGDRVLLFLRRTSSALRVVGMSQGAMRIVPGDPAMVEPGGNGLALVRRSATGALIDVDDAPQTRPLEDVLDDVRSAIAARRPPTVPGATGSGTTQR